MAKDMAGQLIGVQNVGSAINMSQLAMPADAGFMDRAMYLAQEAVGLQRQLANFDGETEAVRAKMVACMVVQYLDPDIEAMRSLSGAAKLRLQKNREYERGRARDKGWLLERLEQALNFGNATPSTPATLGI